jgi:hypothetical protein
MLQCRERSDVPIPDMPPFKFLRWNVADDLKQPKSYNQQESGPGGLRWQKERVVYEASTKFRVETERRGFGPMPVLDPAKWQDKLWLAPLNNVRYCPGWLDSSRKA